MKQRQIGMELEFATIGEDDMDLPSSYIPIAVVAAARSLGHGYKGSYLGVPDKSGEKQWEVGFDESCGLEVRLPPMRNLREMGKGLKTFYQTGNSLNCLSVSRGCGLHIHIDCSKNRDTASIARLLLFYEQISDLMNVFPSHRSCMAKLEGIPKDLSNIDLIGESILLGEDDYDLDCHLRPSHNRRAGRKLLDVKPRKRWELFEIISERFRALNIEPVSWGNQPTVEFRRAVAFTDPEDIIIWASLCRKVVDRGVRYGTTGTGRKLTLNGLLKLIKASRKESVWLRAMAAQRKRNIKMVDDYKAISPSSTCYVEPF